MKILTNNQFEMELSKARAEMEERLYRRQERDEMMHRIWGLERRIEILENKLGCGPAICDGECTKDFNSSVPVR